MAQTEGSVGRAALTGVVRRRNIAVRQVTLINGVTTEISGETEQLLFLPCTRTYLGIGSDY